MSLGFELAASGSANQYANALGDSKPVDQLSPSTMEGFVPGVAKGVVRGGVNLLRNADMAGAVVPIVADKLTGGTTRQDEYFERHDRIFNRAAEYWTPRPDEVGSAGKLVGGFAEMALPLLIGRRNPTALIASTGLGTAEDLVRQGVDPTTARGVGQVQALALGAGFKIPFVGRNLMERIASGSAANFGVGVAGRAASSDVLAKAGYAEQARQYDPFDTEAIAIDVLMGAVFGGIAHVTTPKGRQATRITQDSPLASALDAMPETQRDALLTANNARHADVETAPGRPRSLDAQNDHADALAQAMDELDAGQPVTAQVDPALFEAAARHRQFLEGLTREVDGVRGKPLAPDAAPGHTAAELSRMDYDTLDAAHAQAVDLNYRLEVQAVEQFLGADKRAEFEAQRTRREKDAWLERNITDDAQTWLNERQVPEGTIAEYRAAANDFDTESPEMLGRSIAVLAKDVDNPGFLESPAGATFRNALNYAREQGWNLDQVAAGMRARSAEWAGRNAEELFARLFRPPADARAAPAALPRAEAPAAEPAASSPQAEGAKQEAPAPEITAAERAVAEIPDLHIPLDDGTVVLASDALAHADEVIALAQNESRAFEAAISCALRAA
jgi:hypothetical protein